jgi:Amt family ammonium transporter
LFYGDASQFLAQVIGVGTNIIAIGILGYATFKINDLIFGLRVKPEVEAEGLDMDEMGVPGYVGVVDNLAMPELGGHASMGTAAKALRSQM